MISESYFLINEARNVLYNIDYVKVMGLKWCLNYIKKHRNRVEYESFDKKDSNNPKKINRVVGAIFSDILIDWLSGDNQDVTKTIVSDIDFIPTNRGYSLS